jgi:hypothetical protein
MIAPNADLPNRRNSIGLRLGSQDPSHTLPAPRHFPAELARLIARWESLPAEAIAHIMEVIEPDESRGGDHSESPRP